MARITCIAYTPNNNSLIIEKGNNHIEYRFDKDNDKLSIEMNVDDHYNATMLINQEDLKQLIKFLQLAVK